MMAMTVEERLERIEKVIEAMHEFVLSRAESEVEFAKSLSETQSEIMEALIVLATAVDELGQGAARGSLEAQHQHFKRARDS